MRCVLEMFLLVPFLQSSTFPSDFNFWVPVPCREDENFLSGALASSLLVDEGELWVEPIGLLHLEMWYLCKLSLVQFTKTH